MSRVEKREDELVLKGKEMALLKATVGELKHDLKSKDMQINALRQQV